MRENHPNTTEGINVCARDIQAYGEKLGSVQVFSAYVLPGRVGEDMGMTKPSEHLLIKPPVVHILGDRNTSYRLPGSSLFPVFPFLSLVLVALSILCH